MTTRFTLSRTIEADLDTVAAVLRDHERIEERISLEVAAQARVHSINGSRETWQLVIYGMVPMAWMPSAAMGMMGPPMVRREMWALRRDELRERLEGKLRIEIVGAPVSCEAVLRVEKSGRHCVVSYDFEIIVYVLLLGPTMEQSIRDQISPALNAELELLARQTADFTG